MRGPFLPIYGSGAIVMLIVGIPLKSQPILMFFAGLICASTLEFFTGEAMERLFKVKYWDYSECFLNIRGHICFKASMAWGVFTLLMNYFVHRPIEQFVLEIPANILQLVVTIILIYFVADYSIAFKTAMDLRDVIIAIERFKEELDRMEKRLDVVIAFAEDSKDQAIEKLVSSIEEEKHQAKRRLEDRMEALEARVELAKNKLEKRDLASDMEAKKAEFMQQISEIKLSNAVMKKRLRESASRRGVLYRNMIRNNPLTSRKFVDTLEEIKKHVDEYKK